MKDKIYEKPTSRGKKSETHQKLLKSRTNDHQFQRELVTSQIIIPAPLHNKSSKSLSKLSSSDNNTRGVIKDVTGTEIVSIEQLKGT